MGVFDPTLVELDDHLAIGVAQPHEVDEVCSVLLEAASWLEGRGMPLWRSSELEASRVRPDVEGGSFVLARWDGDSAGTFKFQLTDPQFWPEVGDDSAFVHRLAVRRKFAGRGVSTAMLAWAADRALSLGRTYLRLDCDARRPPLRDFYERHGFVFHSEVRVAGEWAGLFDAARYELPLEP
jgi:GNAT superfamily N-acetyltransferase